MNYFLIAIVSLNILVAQAGQETDPVLFPIKNESDIKKIGDFDIAAGSTGGAIIKETQEAEKVSTRYRDLQIKTFRTKGHFNRRHS